MVKGLYLTLMAGPLVPVPMPQAVMDALTSVEVTSGGSPSGFQLTFTLARRSPLETVFLFTGGSLPPIFRVILIASLNGSPEVLIDGVMTRHEISPAAGGHSTLTITGEDLTRAMDYIDFSGLPYPAMPATLRVLVILAKYAALGIVPMVVPSVATEVPLPTDRIERHQGSDLQYIRQLADESGYVFYIEPGPVPGTSLAYWGPEIRIGMPQPALNTDMDAHTNVESLNFSFDSESKTLPVVYIQEKTTKAPIPIPIPDITPLSPPLGAVPPIPKKVVPMKETAKLSPVHALMLGMAESARTANAVTGNGSLDVLRYGRLLKARQLVGVRGAGMAFDGLYYVRSVTHHIRRGEYKQDFSLVRNGLISTVPMVPA